MSILARWWHRLWGWVQWHLWGKDEASQGMRDLERLMESQ